MWGVKQIDNPRFKIFVSEGYTINFDPVENAEATGQCSSNPWGDWVGLSLAMRLMIREFEDDFKVCEVGTAHGHTAYDFYKYLTHHAKDKKKMIWAIDSILHGYDPYNVKEETGEMKFVDGKSTDQKIIDQIPDGLTFLFIDGCHCDLHTYKDLCNYSPKLKVGGFVAMHDTHPEFQGGTEQPKTPECNQEDTHIGCVRGIQQFNMKEKGFRLVLQEIPQDKNYGGVTIFQKVK